MLASSGSSQVRGNKFIDLCVIAVAGLFFVNIILGNPHNEDDQLLFLAAEVGGSVSHDYSGNGPG